ncbi:MAG: amino acid ABC transporter permease [Thermoplasmata archaeon]
MFGWVRSRALYVEIARFLVLIALILGVIWLLGSLGYLDLPFIITVFPLIFQGAAITLAATAFILPVALGVGFLVGWARFSRNPLAYWVTTLFVEIFRGTPQLVLVLAAFFIVLPLVAPAGASPMVLAFWVGSFALALHSAAYQGEIFRAGFQSVPTGQIEAAHAVGLDSWQTMKEVILPQAFRVSLPTLGNEFANVVKDSSILGFLGVLCIVLCSFDLAGWGRQIAQLTFNVNTAVFSWIVIAIVYFIIIYVMSTIMLAVERRLRVPGLEAAL